MLNLQIVKKQPMESTKQRGVFELLPLGTNLQSKVFNVRPPTYWANILTAMMLYKKAGTGIKKNKLIKKIPPPNPQLLKGCESCLIYY